MSTRATKSRLIKWTGAALLFGSIAAAAPAAVNAASAKNNLIIGIQEPNGAWCTQDSPGIDQVAAKNSVLETLTIVNDKGKMVPYLAKSVTMGADAKTWTVVLRPGITYSDGTPFDATNVLMNMYAQAGLGPIVFAPAKVQQPSLPAIAWTDLFGSSIDELKAAYAAFIASGGKDPSKLLAVKAKVDAAVKVVDSTTIQFNLATPRPNFLFLLWNFGRSALLSTNSLKSPDCGITPAATIGTGPFVVASKGAVGTTTDTVLTANPKYWRSTAKKPLPKSQQVTFRILGDSSAKVAAVRTNAVDIATFSAGEGTSLNSLKKMGKKVSLYKGPIETAWTLHLNTVGASGSPFASQNAREAFAYALDVKTYAEKMTKGNGLPSYAIAPPTHPFYVKGVSKTFNLAKAKAAVEAYKAETKKSSLDIIVPRTTTSQSGEGAQLICDMMAKAGINCTVGTPVTSTQYILAGFGLKNQLSNFNVSSGFYADFALLFATKTDLELSGFRFTDPSLAQCFTDARAISTRKAFTPCVTQLSQKSYWIPLYLEGGFLAWNKTAQGVGATPLPGGGARPLVNGSGFDFASVTKVNK
jgi:peptide/nickel transport system substrate-binding protein